MKSRGVVMLDRHHPPPSSSPVSPSGPLVSVGRQATRWPYLLILTGLLTLCLMLALSVATKVAV